MLKNRKDLLNLLDEFTEICKEENLWYSMDENSLLGVVKHEGFIPWIQKVQVMMTVESYNKLNRLFINRIVDSSTEERFKENLKGYFVNNKNDLFSSQPFIEIRILIPTTHKKIKKFKMPCILNRIKYGRMNTKRAINLLNDNFFEGYIALEGKKQKFNQSWIQVLSKEVITKTFEGIEVEVIKEYDTILYEWFGPNYTEVKPPVKLFKYISPLVTTKEQK